MKASQATFHEHRYDGKTGILPLGVRRKATAFKRDLQIYMGERPALFFSLQRLKRSSLAVQPKTQLVIEGFPRSANTFSVWAFRQAQHSEVHLAHHLHYPAQVIRAAQWRIPILLLIRRPEDAVISLIMRRPLLTSEQALRQYISFYGTAAKYRDAFVLGRFTEVTEDYGTVIERINDKFGTGFALFDHTEENVRKVYSRIDELHSAQHSGKILEASVARPSSAKEEMKRKMKPNLDALKRKDLLAEAVAVYEQLTTR